MHPRSRAKRLRLLFSIDRLAGTLWFIPAVMAVASLLAATLSLYIDSRWQPGDDGFFSVLFQANVSGAQAMLSTIAGSMMTVAGVVFSVTVVALTLASSQFGPRLLRGFITDNVNQAVLGTFIATFLFSLIILKAAYQNADTPFIPHVSLLVSLFFALASIAALILFIHRITISIQASSIIGRVLTQFASSIDHLTTAKAPSAPSAGADFHADLIQTFAAPDSGYLARVDTESIITWSQEVDRHLALHIRLGEFVAADMALFTVSGPPLTDADRDLLRGAITIATQRIPIQDLACSILQIVEIAVRSLSPGINDPFTAIACIDRLSGPLRVLAGRYFAPEFVNDDNDMVRLHMPTETWPSIMAACFAQIRQNAQGKPAVFSSLFAAYARIASGTTDPDRLSSIKHHADMAWALVESSVGEAHDRTDCAGVHTHMSAVIAAQRVRRVTPEPPVSTQL